MTLHLAEPLVVRSVVSREFGRVLHLRVVGQNSILINFPASVPADTELELTIVYGGRLQSQQLDREALDLQEREPQFQREELVMPVEPRLRLQQSELLVSAGPGHRLRDGPADHRRAGRVRRRRQRHATRAAVAGRSADARPASGQAVRVRNDEAGPVLCLHHQPLPEPRRRAVDASILGHRIEPGEVCNVGRRGVASNRTVNLYVEANPREFGRARGFADRTTDMLTFYTSLLGDMPYVSFTVAITESELPGGHSPPYFAIVNQPLPSSPLVWRNDPVAFENYPSFFLAHEVAHQWWGQAVGWKNYHEQWLSEGFAQYFAALYAERERGPEQFANVIRQMRRWAIDMSPQGPVYLGYRLGHIKGDPKVFRAIIYNKGAMVLHMLRRLMGDRAFFAGLRDFYTTQRFKKAGTDDFRDGDGEGLGSAAPAVLRPLGVMPATSRRSGSRCWTARPRKRGFASSSLATPSSTSRSR